MIVFCIDAADAKVKAEIRFGVNATKEDFLQNSTKWRYDIEKTVNIDYEVYQNYILPLLTSFVYEFVYVYLSTLFIKKKTANGIPQRCSGIFNSPRVVN